MKATACGMSLRRAVFAIRLSSSDSSRTCCFGWLDEGLRFVFGNEELGVNMSLIYHYTSASAVISIIRHQRIWATHFLYLNDLSEVQAGARMLSGAIIAYADEWRSRSDRDDLSLRVHRQAEGVASKIRESFYSGYQPNRIREWEVFITSFAKDPMSLTLWRSYAYPNGLCLGFDRQVLAEYLQQASAGIAPRCDGDPEGNDSAFAGLVGDFGDVVYDHVTDGLLDYLASEALRRCVQAGGHGEVSYGDLLRASARFKSSYFCDECETRLVVCETGDFAPPRKIRVNPRGEMVSYHEVPFPREALREIWIGPGQNESNVRFALGGLLSDGGRGAWGHVEVKNCGIPFRG